MYERINGKLYQQVNESELADKLNVVLDQIVKCNEGIKTCDRSINAFNDQKQKYLAEIDRLMSSVNLDKELVKQLAPEKASLLGF